MPSHSRPRVAVTRVIPAAGLKLLEEHAEVTVWPEELPPPPAELAALLADADGAITLLTDQVDAALLDRAPRLRVIANLAVGFDNIDIEAATARSVAICNTPDVLTEATADATWALLMAAARRLVEGVEYVRAGKWLTWGPTVLLGREVTGATIGIIGLGRIGKEVARRAHGFRMRILYHGNHRDKDAERDLGAEFVDLETLLRESDYVTLHLSLSPEAVGLIDAEALALMKPSAILINAARGPVVDTDALVTALTAGVIFGAALDVTDPEPLPADHPLCRLENCIVVPHTASATVQTRDAMAELAARNVIAVLRGETPPACVNPEVLG